MRCSSSCCCGEARPSATAWFNLGMAPLAGLYARALAPLWNRFGALVFGRGERFITSAACASNKEKIRSRLGTALSAAPAICACRACSRR